MKITCSERLSASLATKVRMYGWRARGRCEWTKKHIRNHSSEQKIRKGKVGNISFNLLVIFLRLIVRISTRRSCWTKHCRNLSFPCARQSRAKTQSRYRVQPVVYLLCGQEPKVYKKGGKLFLQENNVQYKGTNHNAVFLICLPNKEVNVQN